MEKLIHSGLPLYFNSEDNKIYLSGELKLEQFAAKRAPAMGRLLANDQNIPDIPYYDVYRNIRFPKDENAFASRKIRYDITVIMSGVANGERKKTSGHYHGFAPDHVSSYPEVYEVLQGTALYVLQKSMDFEVNPENPKIDDLMLVEVKEGQAIVLPPNYGHCSVNIGSEPLIFSNLAFIDCPVFYDSVKTKRGMAYYVMEGEHGVYFKPNPNYTQVPTAYKAKRLEPINLGLKDGIPSYTAYVNDPDSFMYLQDPNSIVDLALSYIQKEEEIK